MHGVVDKAILLLFWTHSLRLDISSERKFYGTVLSLVMNFVIPMKMNK